MWLGLIRFFRNRATRLFSLASLDLFGAPSIRGPWDQVQPTRGGFRHASSFQARDRSHADIDYLWLPLLT
jgi:hypothetical protein